MNDEQRIFHSIEQAIVEHRLAPGTRLREQQLSQIFGVKRGQIRKVLSSLAHSKLIEQLPNIGARVACPSPEEGQELFATRRVLEASVIDSLCTHISTQQIQQLEHYLEQENLAYQQGNFNHGVRLSSGFHKLLAQMANNRITAEFLETIINRVPLVVMDNNPSQTDKGCANHEHRDLVEALKSGDKARALKIMDQHLEHLQQRFSSRPPQPSNNLSEIFDTQT